MSRLVVSVVAVVVLLVAVLVFLAGRDSERPQTHVEKAVALANLT